MPPGRIYASDGGLESRLTAVGQATRAVKRCLLSCPGGIDGNHRGATGTRDRNQK
jgi:hypothetical protein